MPVYWIIIGGLAEIGLVIWTIWRRARCCRMPKAVWGSFFLCAHGRTWRRGPTGWVRVTERACARAVVRSLDAELARARAGRR